MKSRTTFAKRIAVTFASAFLLSSVLVAASATAPVTLRVELDRSVLPADTTDRAIIKVAIDGARLPRAEARPPVNLCIVFDRSGSMGGEKIAQARQAAVEALDHLAAGDIFSLVTFDSSVETLIPATRIGSDTRALERRIRQISVGGNTALFAGVSQGASEIRKNIEDSRYVHRIILLSDGQANSGPRTPEELGRLGAALMKEGVSVTTIGLGLGYDEDLMARLALKSDGNTYFVENATDLVRIFDAELGDVLNVVARRAVVTIEFPEGVRPIRFVGREGSIRGQNAELSLNQIYGGQEKYALIEIETPKSRAGSEREIARAQIAFEDAITNRPATLKATSRARFSEDKDVVIKSANYQLQVDYAANRIAEAKDKAVAFADAGKTAEAAQTLQKETIYLDSFNAAYGNSGVTSLSVGNFAAAAKVQKQGIDNIDRKNYRASNNMVIMQQSKTSSSGGLIDAGDISITGTLTQPPPPAKSSKK